MRYTLWLTKKNVLVLQQCCISFSCPLYRSGARGTKSSARVTPDQSVFEIILQSRFSCSSSRRSFRFQLQYTNGAPSSVSPSNNRVVNNRWDWEGGISGSSSESISYPRKIRLGSCVIEVLPSLFSPSREPAFYHP